MEKRKGERKTYEYLSFYDMVEHLLGIHRFFTWFSHSTTYLHLSSKQTVRRWSRGDWSRFNYTRRIWDPIRRMRFGHTILNDSKKSLYITHLFSLIFTLHLITSEGHRATVVKMPVNPPVKKGIINESWLLVSWLNPYSVLANSRFTCWFTLKATAFSDTAPNCICGASDKIIWLTT